jgi:hypothetical protein
VGSPPRDTQWTQRRWLRTVRDASRRLNGDLEITPPVPQCGCRPRDACSAASATRSNCTSM